MRTWLMAFPLLAVCSAGAACSIPLKAKKAPIERPALDVPPPPPRVIEPTPVQDVPPEPVPDLPPAAPAPIKPTRPAQPRPNNSGNSPTAEPKVDAKPETTPTDPAPVPAPPPASVPQLRTPQTADGTEADKTVRTTLERAKTVLSTVNFNPLSNERKKAYNDAKNFIQLAEDALKQGNYVFAQGAATKAETLAHELAGR
jgi:hypothetical protein